jgi:hypothetical protein
MLIVEQFVSTRGTLLVHILAIGVKYLNTKEYITPCHGFHIEKGEGRGR